MLVTAVAAGAEHAFGLTLSRAQYEHVQNLGDPRIGVALRGFAEHTPDERYDALCCIGALEHFARPDHTEAERLALYREFFGFCHRVLAPGSRMYLQFLAYGAAERDQLPPFFEHQVFPESDMPRLWEVCQALEHWFEVTRVRNDRADYVRTLNAWRRNLRRNHDAAEALVGAATVTRYLKFLGLSAIALQVGTTVLYRLSLRRIDRA
jgi:cyclopropane-fatty-acyl-phospholipid synthase